MLILGLDFETMGLDPKIHKVSEVGAVLWDTDLHRGIHSMGYLVRLSPDTPFEDEALKVTGLTIDILAKYGKDSERALKQLLNMYEQADLICAHNGKECDRGFLRAWMEAHGLLEVFPEEKFWIDTQYDIDYPKKWNRQLTCLAAYHGFVNPFPHQALMDVYTMFRILDQYDINQVLDYAKQPTVTLQALVSFDDKEKAKALGYWAQYENGKFRMWMKTAKESKVQDEVAEAAGAGFEVKIIPPVK